MTGLTPAKALPNSVKKVSNQLEFFETTGGQVFFRRKVLADSAVKPSAQTSGKKSKFGNNLGRGENPWLPRRMPISIKKMGETFAAIQSDTFDIQLLMFHYSFNLFFFC